MSMLAGPRRKQKVINLRAKNNAWSNDSSKFGQRMLEKMGWSEGKGLGAKENGIVEHVVARYKNDEKGLGFEDKNDQWTKHEDDFNALLANLSNGNDKSEQLHSGVSLEVKSKKSKARIHYHKFTRGKDIARYSEKDLANIFGKKSLKKEEITVETIQTDDVKITEQVFTEKGSMEEYFKNKLSAFKNKANVSCLSSNDVSNDADYSFKGFSQAIDDNAESNETQQGFGFQSFSFYTTKETITIENENEKCEEDTVVQKSKKNKKSKNKNAEVEHNVINLEGTNEDVPDLSQQPVKKKKSSKKKKTDDQHSYENTSDPVDADMAEDNESKVPKKRKKKRKQEQTEDFQEVIEEEAIHVPKKKKKRKNKDVDN